MGCEGGPRQGRSGGRSKHVLKYTAWHQSWYIIL